MSMDVRRKHNRASRGWVVAPTYALCMEFKRVCDELLREAIQSSTEKRILLFDGSEIEFKSADNKDENLRGAGLDWVIVDEAARIKKEAWESGLRSAISDKLGRAMFFSTPKGKNWFFDIYVKGLSGKDDHESWKAPSNANPYYPQSEFDVLKDSLPEQVFRQEILADFLDDGGSVFRSIDKCIFGDLMAPEPNRAYVMGVDLAKQQDFTVIVVFDANAKHLVYFERFNKLDWNFQKAKIKAVADMYNKAQCWVDSTGVGDPIQYDLQSQGVRVVPYHFTNESKAQLIQFGVIAIEQRMITFPKIEELYNELSVYDYEILSSGRFRYSAPQGLHDDCVTAFCLALQGIKQPIYFPQKEKKEPTPTEEFWKRVKASGLRNEEDDEWQEV